MEYWVIYSFIVTYYILGLLYFFFITKNKTKYNKYKKGDHMDNHLDDLKLELLAEAEL